MNTFHKVKLSLRYAAGLYVISAIVSLSAVALVLSDPVFLPDCLVLKCASAFFILYLFATFQKKPTLYFYLNLGISKLEYYAVPITVDSAVFILLMIISDIVAYAIG